MLPYPDRHLATFHLALRESPDFSPEIILVDQRQTSAMFRRGFRQSR